MKNETPEQERIGFEEPEKDGAAEQYNEDMARNAAKSLFDDDDPTVADAGRYVAGFERPERAERAAPPDRAARHEPAGPVRPRAHSADERPSGDGYAGPAADTAPHPRRERPGMPPPRPAVKVNIASSTSPPRAQGLRARPAQPRNAGEPLDDEYDGFRQRYKNQESVPSPRFNEPPRQNAKPHRAFGEREIGSSYEDAEPVSMVRYIAAGIVFVFLIIAAIMLWRIVVLTSQLKDANAIIEAQPSNEKVVNDLTIENEGLKADLDLANASIAQLEAQVAAGSPAGIEPTGFPQSPSKPGADESIVEPTPAPTEQYTVVQGDSLSRIASRFYGSSSAANIQKIRDANGLTGDTINIGQELTIPPQ